MIDHKMEFIIQVQGVGLVGLVAHAFEAEARWTHLWMESETQLMALRVTEIWRSDNHFGKTTDISG